MAKQVGSVALVVALAAAAVFLASARSANAQATVASDRVAGYVVYPKIVSDPEDIFHEGQAIETAIQLTNTSASTRVVHCFYVDATKHCSNGTNSFDPPPDGKGACRDTRDCDFGGVCQQDWTETDFTVVMSPGQPLGWDASEGVAVPAPGLGKIDAVPETAFVGELKCFEVDGTAIVGPGATSFTPLFANDLKGEATIYEAVSGLAPASRVDVRTYNAIGIQAAATQPQPASGERVLCLGSNSNSADCKVAGYAACPSRLILNHLFDDTAGNILGFIRTTDLTLVPCSENFAEQANQVVTSVQFLVFNEFEQRLSASTRLECFKETQLSHIDSRPGRERDSIFNIATEGTLAGQTWIRPVLGPETDTGHGILAVAEEFDRIQFPGEPVPEKGSVAWNVNYFPGTNPNTADVVRFQPGN